MFGEWLSEGAEGDIERRAALTPTAFETFTQRRKGESGEEQ